jgi:carbonic anhydrase
MLSCADSRVKISRIFDKKDGRIFSIKNAGNHAYSNFTLADLEYGVMHLHTPLLIVMGHEKCGALSATCTHKGRINEGHLSVLAIFDTIGQIRERSDIIAGLERGGKVDILAMYYSISSGHAALLVPCENNSLIINNIRR